MLNIIKITFFKTLVIIISTQIDHPQQQSKNVYHSVVSIQRKRVVIACFRQTSLHSLPRFMDFFLFIRVMLRFANNFTNKLFGFQVFEFELILKKLTNQK
jgi:hypothetical protein